MHIFKITCTDELSTILPVTCIKKGNRVNFDFMLTLKKDFFLLLFCTATAKTLCQNHQSGREQEVEKADGEEG